jgi:hypothetical protein
VKALSEELENPMNVHRWRKLEGSDPKRYELIQKIQTLQVCSFHFFSGFASSLVAAHIVLLTIETIDRED